MNVFGIFKKHKNITAFIFLILFVLVVIKLIPVIFWGFVCAYCFMSLTNIIKDMNFIHSSFAKSVSTLCLFICFIFLLFLFPFVLYEISAMIKNTPLLIAKIMDQFIEKKSSVYSSLFGFMKSHSKNIAPLIRPMIQFVFYKSSYVISLFFSSIYSLTTFVVTFLVFITNWEHVSAFIVSCLPVSHRSFLLSQQKLFDALFIIFLKNQIVYSFINASLYAVLMKFIGFPFCLSLFSVVFFSSFVPYFGSIVGFLMVLIVFFQHAFSLYVFYSAIAVFFIIYLFENYLLVPQFLGKNIEIHPIIIIASFPVFLKFFGFSGAFLCIPITLYLKIIYKYFFTNYAVYTLKNKTTI